MTTPKEYQQKKCPLNKCDGSGLNPLRSKRDNSIIPRAWTFCECHEDEPEHYLSLNLTDWDFPCSNLFRAFSYDSCGVQDPGSAPLSSQPNIADLDDRLNDLEAISAESGSMPRQYHDSLQQIRGQVLYLQNKLQEQIKKRAKRFETYSEV